ncbi:TonB-dependent receptor [Phenylobacterium sp. LjRoot219]|uniref:TonB-dependent receptor n=1 Tax=Phenylobacterium sp. LjRoot219 TaxID=3342283 RepID=UPI003ECCAD9D
MKLRNWLLAATACVSAAPTLAAAQETEIGEIIVTARKRQESILNVPVIETAIGQAQLERMQTQDLKDISKLVPSLSLGSAIGALGTQVSLRGIGTSTSNAGVDQSVSLNLDGLQLSQGLAYSSGMFDVAQVEVLKGPQALFYGKNSPGGVIAIRTADPGSEFEVIGRYGHEIMAEENRAELIVSGPVTDTLGLRLAALYDVADGYYRNEAIAAPGTGALAPEKRSAPTTRSHMLRGTAVWRPTSQFNARLKLNWVRDRVIGGDAGQIISCPDRVSAPSGVPFLGGGEDCVKNRTLRTVNMDPAAFLGVRNGGEPYRTTNQQFGVLELNYSPTPEITLNSTTGYYRVETESSLNGSLSTYAGPGLVSDTSFDREDFTQEVRANSDFTGPLNFTLGAFYQDGEITNRTTLFGNTAIRLPRFLASYVHNIDIKSVSAFGQLRWAVTDQLEVAGGARWTDEERSNAPFNLITGAPVAFPIAVPKIQSDNVSPELTVTYRPTDDLTVFGSLKKGFKSGSFNLNPLSGVRPDISFGDEKVEGGEIGLKSRLLDRRLAMNLSAYDYRYTGLQVGVNEPAQNGVPVARTLNAGSALVYGVDFDVSYRPPQLEGLEVHGAVAWNHARFKTLNNVPCWGGQSVGEGCNQALNPATGLFTGQNLEGRPLVRAPDWQANFGFSYETDIGHGMSVVLANENQYSSKYLTVLGLRDDFYQRGFIKTDLSLTFRGPEERWEFALIGKNLGGELTTGNCSVSNIANGSVLGGQVTGGTTRGPAGIDEVACYMDRGREVWLRLTVRPFN